MLRFLEILAIVIGVAMIVFGFLVFFGVIFTLEPRPTLALSFVIAMFGCFFLAAGLAGITEDNNPLQCGSN